MNTEFLKDTSWKHSRGSFMDISLEGKYSRLRQENR